MYANSIFTEASPLSKQDSLAIYERNKNSFNFPVHRHDVYELNFIQNATGARRVVGDSISEISDLELVLIADKYLEHGWQDYKNEGIIHEITIQFAPDFFLGGIFEKNNFFALKKMLQNAAHGISFSKEIIMKTQDIIQYLAISKEGIPTILEFIRLMTILADSKEYTIISQRPTVSDDGSYDSLRIKKIIQYLKEHYSERVSLDMAAQQAHMTPASYSRLLKRCTGKNFINTINDIRISEASRLLLEESQEIVADIAFRCGFNNISNFNRIFKRKKGMTPLEYRESYFAKHTII